MDQNCSSENVKWVRRYPAPISAEEFDFVDYILCTHAHFDHSDPDTLGTLAKINSKAKFIAPKPIKDTILFYGIDENRFIGALADKNGDYFDLGYKIILGNTFIYHAGDCYIYDGLTERLMNVDVLMVPVNGRSYYKRYVEDIIGNMTCEEAIILAKKPMLA